MPTILRLSSLLFPNKVHRLPVEECSNFTDCSICITNGGLLCGWCSVENKCSRRPQCANSNSSDGLRWVQTTDRCLTVDIASAVSISGEETAYPRETSRIVSWDLVTPLDSSSNRLKLSSSISSNSTYIASMHCTHTSLYSTSGVNFYVICHVMCTALSLFVKNAFFRQQNEMFIAYLLYRASLSAIFHLHLPPPVVQSSISVCLEDLEVGI